MAGPQGLLCEEQGLVRGSIKEESSSGGGSASAYQDHLQTHHGPHQMFWCAGLTRPVPLQSGLHVLLS